MRNSLFRKRTWKLLTFYGMQDFFCKCVDINELMRGVSFEHKAKEWLLFIYLSKLSLKNFVT
jgi:hypothetical protein